MVSSDNGLIFQCRRFRTACRDYRLRQEFITPYTPEQNGIVERFFRSFKEECVWQHNSATSPKPELPLLIGFNGTTPNGHTRPSAIAVHISSVGYNLNWWLDSGGALHVLRRLFPRSSVSSTAASSHILIRCSIAPSTIRRATDFKSSACGIESK